MPRALKLQLHIFVPFNYGYSILYTDLQSFAIIQKLPHEFCILIKFLASRARKYYTHLKSFTVPVAEEKLMPTLNILRGSAAYGRA